jgi:hypothetical protein
MAPYTQVYRSGPARLLGVLTVAICLGGLVTMAVRGSQQDLLRYAAPLLAVAWVGWFGYWRPDVVMDDHGVTLHNVVRTVRLPWGAVQDVHSRYGLRLDTTDGSFDAWAVAAPAGRDRLRGGDTEAAAMARQRLARVRGLGLREAPDASGEPEVGWVTPAISTGAAIVVLGVLGPLLSL